MLATASAASTDATNRKDNGPAADGAPLLARASVSAASRLAQMPNHTWFRTATNARPNRIRVRQASRGCGLLPRRQAIMTAIAVAAAIAKKIQLTGLLRRCGPHSAM